MKVRWVHHGGGPHYMYMCILTAVDHPTSASDVAAEVEDGLESTLYVSLG